MLNGQDRPAGPGPPPPAPPAPPAPRRCSATAALPPPPLGRPLGGSRWGGSAPHWYVEATGPPRSGQLYSGVEHAGPPRSGQLSTPAVDHMGSLWSGRLSRSDLSRSDLPQFDVSWERANGSAWAVLREGLVCAVFYGDRVPRRRASGGRRAEASQYASRPFPTLRSPGGGAVSAENLLRHAPRPLSGGASGSASACFVAAPIGLFCAYALRRG